MCLFNLVFPLLSLLQPSWKKGVVLVVGSWPPIVRQIVAFKVVVWCVTMQHNARTAASPRALRVLDHWLEQVFFSRALAIYFPCRLPPNLSFLALPRHVHGHRWR